ncbi:MAG: sterol desaturase family protein [Pseudomonadota bacterium]
MEITAYLVHRYVMHGRLGWGWHRSHHEEGEGWWERNDLYGVVFAVFSAILIFAGTQGGVWPFVQIGIGFIVYGLLYYVVHDGLVHQRWPFRYVPKRGYAKRLVQAHKLHHAVDGREGCVSFGFLYAPQIAALKAQLKENASAKKRRERAETAEPLAAERS